METSFVPSVLNSLAQVGADYPSLDDESSPKKRLPADKVDVPLTPPPIEELSAEEWKLYRDNAEK